MELISTNKIMEGIEKKIFFLACCFFVSQVQVLNTNYILTIPLLTIAFLSGHVFTIIYFIAITLSFLLFDTPITLLLLSILCIAALEISSYVYSMKSKYIPSLLSILVCLALLFDFIFIETYSLPMVFVSSILTYIMSYLYLDNATFFVHKDYNNPSYNNFLVVAMITLTAIVPLQDYQEIAMFVLIRFVILAVTYCLSFEKGYQLVFYISLVLLLNNIEFKDQIIAMIIPLSSFYLLKPNNKITFSICYLMAHLIIPFFIDDRIIIPYMIEIVASAVLFFIIPNYIYQNIRKLVDEDLKVMNQIGGVVSYQRKMSRKLEGFSELFNQIADSFKDTSTQANVLTYIGNVYDDVCSNCVNKEQCFNRNVDSNRLAKLIKKGVITSLNKEEGNYVERYCINPKEYKKGITQQSKLYKHQLEMNEEYHFLKRNLYNQLSLVGDLLRQFSSNVDCVDLYSEENIKEVLEAYHFKIPYILKDEIGKDEFNLDIGIMETTKQEVFDVVIPVLEKTLDTKLNILDLNSNGNRMGYTRLKLSNKQTYQLIYGIQQLSKDENYCGDNYIFFRYNQFSLIALSDGMGYGKKAHEESKLTLDVFSKLLQNGIDLKDSIQTTNSLLKIKNRIEMFTTLDLLMFDSNDASITFLKNGSMPSYVYHYNRKTKLQTKSLPIGIVSKVDITQETYQCAHDDLVIMYSDGFDGSIEEIVDEVLSEFTNDHPQKIADAIMDALLRKNKVEDDATVIVAKVEEVSKIKNKYLHH